MVFDEKTYEGWMKEFSTYKDCTIKMVAIGSLTGAMTREEWSSIPGIYTRFYADMMDTNAQSHLQTLHVKFVKITGRPAKYFFFYPDKKFPKLPDKVLRPDIPNSDNEKTGRSWTHATSLTELDQWEHTGEEH